MDKLEDAVQKAAATRVNSIVFEAQALVKNYLGQHYRRVLNITSETDLNDVTKLVVEAASEDDVKTILINRVTKKALNRIASNLIYGSE